MLATSTHDTSLTSMQMAASAGSSIKGSSASVASRVDPSPEATWISAEEEGCGGQCSRMYMKPNATGWNRPSAEPSAWTVSCASPWGSMARTRPPGRVWSIHADGTPRTQQVEITRS
jgi:hypothetical protein